MYTSTRALYDAVHDAIHKARRLREHAQEAVFHAHAAIDRTNEIRAKIAARAERVLVATQGVKAAGKLAVATRVRP